MKDLEKKIEENKKKKQKVYERVWRISKRKKSER